MQIDTLPAAASVADSHPALSTPAGDIVGIAFAPGDGWRRIAADGSPFQPDAGYFDAHPVYAGIRAVEIAGLAMIRIPLFFVQTILGGEDGDVARAMFVSPTPRDGFRPHPAFCRGEHVEPAIHVAKHQAGKGLNTEADGKPVSAAGVKPWTQLDFDAAGKACAALGEGWRLWSIHDLSAIQLLMLIEMGGPDMQALIGMGNVDSHGPVGGGESDASWRGLCELWGNVWQMLDGLQVDNAGRIRLWRDGDPAGGWVDTGIDYGPGDGDGYPTALHNETGGEARGEIGADAADGFDLSLLFLPSAVGNRDAAIIPDWSWGAWGNWERVAYCGGNWDGGRNAGPFCLNLNGHRSHANAFIGFRPAFGRSAL